MSAFPLRRRSVLGDKALSSVALVPESTWSTVLYRHVPSVSHWRFCNYLRIDAVRSLPRRDRKRSITDSDIKRTLPICANMVLWRQAKSARNRLYIQGDAPTQKGNQSLGPAVLSDWPSPKPHWRKTRASYIHDDHEYSRLQSKGD